MHKIFTEKRSKHYDIIFWWNEQTHSTSRKKVQCTGISNNFTITFLRVYVFADGYFHQLHYAKSLSRIAGRQRGLVVGALDL